MEKQPADKEKPAKTVKQAQPGDAKPKKVKAARPKALKPRKRKLPPKSPSRPAPPG